MEEFVKGDSIVGTVDLDDMRESGVSWTEGTRAIWYAEESLIYELRLIGWWV